MKTATAWAVKRVELAIEYAKTRPGHPIAATLSVRVPRRRAQPARQTTVCVRWCLALLCPPCDRHAARRAPDPAGGGALARSLGGLSSSPGRCQDSCGGYSLSSMLLSANQRLCKELRQPTCCGFDIGGSEHSRDYRDAVGAGIDHLRRIIDRDATDGKHRDFDVLLDLAENR